MNRRAFLSRSVAAGIASVGVAGRTHAAAPAASGPAEADLARIADRPVLDLAGVTAPVKVASIELLRQGRIHLVRARSTDGVEAVTVPNPARMEVLYPLFLRQIAPHFVGKDARDLERLQADLYRQSSNYKLQGLALWVCVAAVEMALLEMLGRTAKRSVADFFGGVKRRDIPVYAASGNRGNTPEAEIEHLRRLASDFMEFKGNTDLSVACDTSSLRCEQGRVRCPSGPGFGVTLDPDWVAKAVRVQEAT